MEDRSCIALSGLGPDRPGLVAAATRFLTVRGLNVEDSRAVVLGGRFGLMILASGPAASVREVRQGIADLEAVTGMAFLVQETVSPEEHRRRAARSYVVSANALDHEGIVHAVTEALYHAGLNIVALETELRPAPVTGTPIFSLEARVDLPGDVAADDVRSSLASVAREHNLDLEMRPER